MQLCNYINSLNSLSLSCKVSWLDNVQSDGISVCVNNNIEWLSKPSQTRHPGGVPIVRVWNKRPERKNNSVTIKLSLPESQLSLRSVPIFLTPVLFCSHQYELFISCYMFTLYKVKRTKNNWISAHANRDPYSGLATHDLVQTQIVRTLGKPMREW